MSRTTASVHVRGVTKTRFVRAIGEALARDGWERVREPDGRDPILRRIAIATGGGWTSLAEEADRNDAWGEALSRALETSVLTLWSWDGEATVIATRYERGALVARLELLREARRTKAGKVVAPADALEAWLPGEPRSDRRWIVLAEDQEIDAQGTVFVDDETSLDAIGAAVGLRHPRLHAYAREEDDDVEELAFRKKGATRPVTPPVDLPLLPPLPPRRLVPDPTSDVAAYRMRTHGVGWLAFAGPTKQRLEPLATIVPDLIDALGGALGMRLTKDGRATVASAPIDARTWKRALADVKKSAAIELFDDERGAQLWIVHQPHGSPAFAAERRETRSEYVPFVIGWSIRAPADAKPRLALAKAFERAVSDAVSSRACIGAIATAQGRPQRWASAAFPYEELAATSAGGLREEWVRAHARSPGWRVLVPRAATKLTKPPKGVSLHEVAAGTLVALREKTPFDAVISPQIEAFLVPVLG